MTTLGKEATRILGAELAGRIRTVLVAFKDTGVFYNGNDGNGDPGAPRYTALEGIIPQLFGLEHDYPLGFASPEIDKAICHLIYDVDAS